MKVSTANDDDNSRTLFAIFIAAIGFVFLSAAVAALIWKHKAANACEGPSKESIPEHISGVVRRDTESLNWYIRGDSGTRLIYQCRRGGCPLYKQLNNAINQEASATFCQGELVTLDIGPERVFTRQSSTGYFYITALVCMGAVAFIFALFRYGDKKLSFRHFFGRGEK
jgi:hypothetical protein